MDDILPGQQPTQDKTQEHADQKDNDEGSYGSAPAAVGGCLPPQVAFRENALKWQEMQISDSFGSWSSVGVALLVLFISNALAERPPAPGAGSGGET